MDNDEKEVYGWLVILAAIVVFFLFMGTLALDYTRTTREVCADVTEIARAIMCAKRL